MKTAIRTMFVVFLLLAGTQITSQIVVPHPFAVNPWVLGREDGVLKIISLDFQNDKPPSSEKEEAGKEKAI